MYPPCREPPYSAGSEVAFERYRGGTLSCQCPRLGLPDRPSSFHGAAAGWSKTKADPGPDFPLVAPSESSESAAGSPAPWAVRRGGAFRLVCRPARMRRPPPGRISTLVTLVGPIAIYA